MTALKFRITAVDYAPADLYGQVPFDFALIRQIPGPDRPDYWLAQLSTPLTWEQRKITHLVLASRYVGTDLSPNTRQITLGIAYVTDPSLLGDPAFAFFKAEYVAIGTARKI